MAASDEKAIVVLGTGLASQPVVRQTMINFVLKRSGFKMIVVSPSTHFVWPIAMPRAVVPGQIDDDKVIIPLEPTFANYPKDKFEFVQGAASALDTKANKVTVQLTDNSMREIAYHTLVIATGSRARDDMPWKSLADASKTKEKLHHLQEQIKAAKTIVVAGAGLTGVETAGELGYEYSQHGAKEVILVHSDALPLSPPTIPSVRKAAKNELEKLKVRLVPNSKVVRAETKENGDTELEVRAADGSTSKLTAQAYLPTTGVIPNTEFVPEALRDAQGFIKQTTELKVEGCANVFVIGDAGNLQLSKALETEAQAMHLIKALPAHLEGGTVPEYKVDPKAVFAITVGRGRGTGQMGTFRLPSLLIWFMKCRYMGTDNSHLWAAGKKTMMNTLEK